MDTTVIQPGIRRRFSRYGLLLQEIHRLRPKILMEIGVYKAGNAYRMIEAAQSHFEEPVTYYGFDLFEDATKEKLDYEVTLKPASKEDVSECLKLLGANIRLFQGDTKDTLPTFAKLNIKPDFIFLDGGHSKETVASDWSYVKDMMHDNTVVIFDDYLITEITMEWGCNELIESLRVEYNVCVTGEGERHMLRKRGDSPGGGTIPGFIHLARVSKK